MRHLELVKMDTARYLAMDDPAWKFAIDHYDHIAEGDVRGIVAEVCERILDRRPTENEISNAVAALEARVDQGGIND